MYDRSFLNLESKRDARLP